MAAIAIREAAKPGMSSADAEGLPAGIHPVVSKLEAAIGCALAAIAYAAFSIPSIISALQGQYWDTGLAYSGGQLAWATGHPENLATWMSTPFLGVLMAIASRFLSATGATIAVTLLNVLAATLLVSATWWSLRTRVTRKFWWATLVAALVFAPVISTIWWDQFNLLSLFFAASASALMKYRGRNSLAGLSMAVSILIKPVAILIPVAFLLKKDSRRAGIWTVVWGIVLTGFAQAFLAWRAHSFSTLSPLGALGNFLTKSKLAYTWVCAPENFSPQSLLCRSGLSGSSMFTLQRVAVEIGVLFLCWVVYDTLRHERGASWRIFAAAAALSPMVSPLAWSHYQLLLFPPFLVLAYELRNSRPRAILWAGLGIAFLLTELVWHPYGTLPGLFNSVVRGVTETAGNLFSVFALAQWAQYLLLFVAVIWFIQQPGGPVRSNQSAPAVN